MGKSLSQKRDNNIMLGPVAFFVINIPLSIYTAVKLRKGQTDGEDRTILIVFAAINAFIGLVVWGFLIAFILPAKDIEIPKVRSGRFSRLYKLL